MRDVSEISVKLYKGILKLFYKPFSCKHSLITKKGKKKQSENTLGEILRPLKICTSHRTVSSAICQIF